jgi:hypothetical protein
MSGKVINFNEKLEEKREAEKVVDLHEYREKRKTKGMSYEEFDRKYMKNSLRKEFGDDIIDLFNKDRDELPDDLA